MDTRQLKVGQTVALVSGYQSCHAKVLEITPTGCIVLEIDSSRKVRFNIKGQAVPSHDLGYNDNRIYPLAIPGPIDGSPWVIEEIVEPEQ
jgi:hypothetical protein